MFQRTPIKRLKLTGLLRNACVAAGNVAARAGAGHELVAPLVRLAAQAAPLVRGHAVWAVQRIAGGDAPQLLAEARERETHPAVRAEHAAGADGAGAT